MFRSIGLLVCAVFSLALSAQTIDTAHGRWTRLEAYNSGDRARVEAFVQKFEPTISADVILALHEANGRIDLAGIDKADSAHITFKVRQQGGESRAVGEVAMDGEVPTQIQGLNFIGLRQLLAVNAPNR